MALRNESFILGPLGSGAVRLWSARVFALSSRFSLTPILTSFVFYGGGMEAA